MREHLMREHPAQRSVVIDFANTPRHAPQRLSVVYSDDPDTDTDLHDVRKYIIEIRAKITQENPNYIFTYNDDNIAHKLEEYMEYVAIRHNLYALAYSKITVDVLGLFCNTVYTEWRISPPDLFNILLDKFSSALNNGDNQSMRKVQRRIKTLISYEFFDLPVNVSVHPPVGPGA